MSPSISLAPHLQRALEAMSKDMSMEPQALVDQAVAAWLRINGYALPVVASLDAARDERIPPSIVPPPVIPSEVEALVRMAEIDADLEKLAKPWPAWAPVQKEDEEVPEANTGETDMGEPGESTVVLRSVPIALYLEREGEEPIRVTADRFIIGRGPHCDLVIDSPRVSREHVALTRKDILYFIEDLGSSNGTWMGEDRVTHRELESGDVINLGNVPVTFILRGE